VRAIAWLNESAATDFFLLKIEGIQIAGSPPAPLLTLIVGPSAETRDVGETKRELAERHHVREEFWTELLKRARARTRLHSGVKASKDTWVATGAGRSGLIYSYVITQHESGVELYIDRGRPDSAEENMRIFETFAAHRERIEQTYGSELEWQPLEGKRACRIRERFEGGYRDRERWPHIQETMVDAMIRLERALKPHIEGLAL
jgi:hypothetical protein